MGYGVARLPTLQEEKAGHIGGGVTLYLKDNKKRNGTKIFKGREVCSGTPSNKVFW